MVVGKEFVYVKDENGLTFKVFELRVRCKLCDERNKLHRHWKINDGIVQVFFVKECLNNVENRCYTKIEVLTFFSVFAKSSFIIDVFRVESCFI
jgi:hypothetical protein